MAWLLGASLILVLLTSAILYWGTMQVLHYADDQIHEKRMQAMRTLIQDGRPDEAMIAHEVDEELEGPRQIFIRVSWPQGGLSQETQSMDKVLAAGAFPDAEHAPSGNKQIGSIQTADGRSFRLLAVRVPIGSHEHTSNATIQVATETTLDSEMLSWYRRLLASVIAAAALACTAGGIFIVRRELVPLQTIAQATASIGTKTLDYRLPLDGMPDELGKLGTQFNDMLARLDIAYTGLQHYADNIAHELRGPVNRMLLESEVALLKARTKIQYREAVESNVECCRQLRDIVQSLLFLARVDSKRASLELNPINVGREIDGLRDFFEASAVDAGLSLTADCEGALTAEVDKVLFQRAVANLISNAIAHTPRGGTISVSARANDANFEVVVSDTGEGIPPEHMAHVFERFYRADVVRTAGEHRVGLGLAITSSIVELHGGKARIKSEPKQGTIVTLEFPRRAA